MEYEKIIAELLTIPGVLGLPDQGDYFEAALVHTHYQYLEERRGLIVKLGVPIQGSLQAGRQSSRWDVCWLCAPDSFYS
jgi:hypothetical protein